MFECRCCPSVTTAPNSTRQRRKHRREPADSHQNAHGKLAGIRVHWHHSGSQPVDCRPAAYKPNPCVQALRAVYKLDGAAGLMRGWAPTLARDAPCVKAATAATARATVTRARRYAGLFLVLYDSFKRSWGTDGDGCPSAARTFACSTSAGFIATLVTQPFDVLRTRVQLEQHAVRSAPLARAILDKGMAVALAGFWPRLMKRTLASSVTWTVFEQMIGRLQHDDQSPR